MIWLGCTRERRYKRLAGLLMAILAAVSATLYFYMRSISGGADFGQEIVQLYLPIAGYALIILWGGVAFLRNRKI